MWKLKNYFSPSHSKKPVLSTFASVFLIIAAILYGNAQRVFLAESNEITLNVVGLESKQDEDGTHYRSVFETLAEDGSKVRYSGGIWFSPPTHKIGEVVAGRYAPETGKMQSYEIMKDYNYFIGLSALSGILIGIFAIRRWRRYWRDCERNE